MQSRTRFAVCSKAMRCSSSRTIWTRSCIPPRYSSGKWRCSAVCRRAGHPTGRRQPRECLTGNAQLAGVWLRLFQITGDARYLNAGLKAADLALARQVRSRSADLDGALPGSFPLWGRYAPLQYPNWAAKFLADAIMIREDALRSLQ